MSRKLSNVWWLLALCGVLDALHAAMNLFLLDPDRSIILREFAGPHALWDMGILALAAGACALAAGLWNSGRDASWLLSLHGFALGAFGVIAISPLVKGPLSFRPVSVLFAVMAVSLGAFALSTARRLHHGASKRAVWNVAGAVSLGFAFSFLAVGFHLVTLAPRYAYFVWMSSYFAFCALFMLWLAFRVHRQGRPQSSRTEPFSPPRPGHAY